MTEVITGGCQCGATRYRVAALGLASICHCRMCQKAVGGMFAALVRTEGLEWTRGVPGRFDSSNLNWRRFCKDCGTPLTYEFEGHAEVTIGSLDRPDLAVPEVQVNTEGKHPGFDRLPGLPGSAPKDRASAEAWNAKVISNQHPDHDT